MRTISNICGIIASILLIISCFLNDEQAVVWTCGISLVLFVLDLVFWIISRNQV